MNELTNMFYKAEVYINGGFKGKSNYFKDGNLMGSKMCMHLSVTKDNLEASFLLDRRYNNGTRKKEGSNTKITSPETIEAINNVFKTNLKIIIEHKVDIAKSIKNELNRNDIKLKFPKAETLENDEIKTCKIRILIDINSENAIEKLKECKAITIALQNAIYNVLTTNGGIIKQSSSRSKSRRPLYEEDEIDLSAI